MNVGARRGGRRTSQGLDSQDKDIDCLPREADGRGNSRMRTDVLRLTMNTIRARGQGARSHQ